MVYTNCYFPFLVLSAYISIIMVSIRVCIHGVCLFHVMCNCDQFLCLAVFRLTSVMIYVSSNRVFLCHLVVMSNTGPIVDLCNCGLSFFLILALTYKRHMSNGGPWINSDQLLCLKVRYLTTYSNFSHFFPLITLSYTMQLRLARFFFIAWSCSKLCNVIYHVTIKVQL